MNKKAERKKGGTHPLREKERERPSERGYLKVPVFASKLNTLNCEQFLGSSNVCGLIPSVIIDGELRKGEREGWGIFIFSPF